MQCIRLNEEDNRRRAEPPDAILHSRRTGYNILCICQQFDDLNIRVLLLSFHSTIPTTTQQNIRPSFWLVVVAIGVAKRSSWRVEQSGRHGGAVLGQACHEKRRLVGRVRPLLPLGLDIPGRLRAKRAHRVHIVTSAVTAAAHPILIRLTHTITQRWVVAIKKKINY